MNSALNKGREIGRGVFLNLPNSTLNGTAGERLGGSTGSSLEFQDYRDYQPGDDLRRLDWAAYARSDRLTVRLYREEIQPRVDLISDTSISMTVPGDEKTYAALALARMLAEASFKSETAVSWWGFGNGWKRYFHPSNAFPECHLPEWEGGYTLDEEFVRQVPRFANKGIRICISDFLWEVPPEIPLRKLSEGAAEVILISVLTEEEMNPPIYGPSTLMDAENTDSLDMLVSTAEKDAYMKRLESHNDMWQDAAISMRAKFCVVKAEDILDGNIEELITKGILEYN